MAVASAQVKIYQSLNSCGRRINGLNSCPSEGVASSSSGSESRRSLDGSILGAMKARKMLSRRQFEQG
jgi:hypothetical protein